MRDAAIIEATFIITRQETRRIALEDALRACEALTAGKGSGAFGHGWIAARETCIAAIRELSDAKEPAP